MRRVGRTESVDFSGGGEGREGSRRRCRSSERMKSVSHEGCRGEEEDGRRRRSLSVGLDVLLVPPLPRDVTPFSVGGMVQRRHARGE